MTDPIADMLTRIRNAITAKKEVVEILPCTQGYGSKYGRYRTF